MRLASSATVRVSGTVTSRGPAGPAGWWGAPLTRWRWRRNEATERMRSSLSDRAAVTVSLPRRRVSAPFRAGTLAGTFTPPFLGASSSSSWTGRPRRVASPVAVGSSFLSSRRLASSSACRRAVSSAALRASSSALRFSAAARSLASRASSTARCLASSSARLRASSSATRASAMARERASFSSSVSWRRTTPARWSRAGEIISGAAGRTSAAGVACFSGAAAGLPPAGGATRARFFSTTTALLRPWLKLCFTVEVSVFFSDSVLPAGRAVRVASFVSLIRTFRPERDSDPFSSPRAAGSPRAFRRRAPTDPQAAPERGLHVSHSRGPRPCSIHRRRAHR